MPVDYVEKLGYDGVGELIFLGGGRIRRERMREDERRRDKAE